MVPRDRSKSARVRELCRQLKPVIGPQADRIWRAYLAEDETGKTQLQDYLELLAAQSFHGALENDGPGLLPPKAVEAAGDYELGTVSYNKRKLHPFGGIQVRRKPPRPWHHVTPAEFAGLLDAVPDARWKAFYLLAYTAGLRFGELFNLTWADVDFEQNRVHVRNREASAALPPAKVKDAEARTLLLPQQTIDALAEWQTRAPEGVPLVLVTAARWACVTATWRAFWAEGRAAEWENRRLTNNLIRTIRVHFKHAGIEARHPVTVHTLRKSFGQNHADNGTPMHVLQGLMGHSDIETTRQFYLQHSDEATEAAMRRVEALLQIETDARLTSEAEIDAQKKGEQRCEDSQAATRQ